MKRKASFGLVFALVLILLAATALAMSLLNVFGNKVSELTKTQGAFSDWSDETKIQFVLDLPNMGFSVSTDQLATLRDASTSTSDKMDAVSAIMTENFLVGPAFFVDWDTDQRIQFVQQMNPAFITLFDPVLMETVNNPNADAALRHDAATDIIMQNYLCEDGISQLNLLEGMIGKRFPEWSYEEKAWYTDLCAKYDILSPNEIRYRLPIDGEISYADALQIANDVLIERFSEKTDAIDAYILCASFEEINAQGDAQWLFEYYVSSADSVPKFSVRLASDGQVLEDYDFARQATSAVLHDPSQTKATPKPNDMQPSEAIEIADSYLTEVKNISAELVASFVKDAVFVYDQRYSHASEPVWIARYHSSMGTIEYQVMITYYGTILDGITESETFEVMYDHFDYIPSFLDDYINADNAHFTDWSVEEKAAFTEEWTPIMDAKKEKYHYFDWDNELFYMTTRHRYGLPGNNHISYEDAVAVASQAAKDLGATDEMLARRNFSCCFDITNPSMPTWRFWLHVVHAGDTPSFIESDGPQYFIEIDASTGALLSISTDTPAHLPWM